MEEKNELLSILKPIALVGKCVKFSDGQKEYFATKRVANEIFLAQSRMDGALEKYRRPRLFVEEWNGNVWLATPSRH